MFNIFGRNSKISINGKTYTGNNISMINGQVYIDGQLQDEDFGKDKRIEISILSNVDKIYSEESINIKGNVNGNVEAKVSVNCDNISGNAVAGTIINCDDIHGDASAGTTINCDVIKGNGIANRISM